MLHGIFSGRLDWRILCHFHLPSLTATERPEKLRGTPKSSCVGLELRKPAAYLGGKDPGTMAAMSKGFLCLNVSNLFTELCVSLSLSLSLSKRTPRFGYASHMVLKQTFCALL